MYYTRNEGVKKANLREHAIKFFEQSNLQTKTKSLLSKILAARESIDNSKLHKNIDEELLRATILNALPIILKDIASLQQQKETLLKEQLEALERHDQELEQLKEN